MTTEVTVDACLVRAVELTTRAFDDLRAIDGRSVPASGRPLRTAALGALGDLNDAVRAVVTDRRSSLLRIDPSQ